MKPVTQHITFLLILGITAGIIFYPSHSCAQWHKSYQQGLEAMQKVDWATAIAHFKEALKEKDKDRNKQRAYGTIFIEYYPHRELGICYFQSGDLTRAKEELAVSIKQASSSRAKEYMQLIANAENPASKAPAEKEEIPEWYALYTNGLNEVENTNWYEAVTFFQQAVQLKDADTETVHVTQKVRAGYFPHREMGICYFNLGDFENALAELNTSLKQASSDRAQEFLTLVTRQSAEKETAALEKTAKEKQPGKTAGGIPPFPATLAVTAQEFMEPSGNNALDPDEKADIKISLENMTQYPGNVQIRLTPLSANTGITVIKDFNAGIIKGLEKKDILIPLVAAADVPAQEVKYRVEVLETYYHLDPNPFVFAFKTVELRKPELIVILKDFSDDTQIAPNNNSDGLVDPMEMIRVEVSVQNIGEGTAAGVKALIDLSRTDEGSIFFRTVEGEMTSDFDIGDLQTGEYRRIPFLFFTNTFYNYDDIQFTVSTSDKNGYSHTEKELTLPMGVRIQKESEIRIEELKGAQGTIVMEKSGLVDVDDVPENTGRLDTRTNALAVIIGIENYKHNARATYKNRDATIMYQYARNVLGIPEKNIFLRTDDGATKAELDYVFDEKIGWLKKRVKKDVSDVIVYLAGHGYPDVSSDTPYFIPQDVRAEQAMNGLSLKDIYGKLAALGAKNVIVFVESCFSGLSADSAPLVHNINPVRIRVRYPEFQNKNFTVITAASGQQVSSNSDALQHGVFTYHLLKGLKGAADANTDKSITIEELWRYLEKSVPEEALNLDREQNPLIFPGLEILNTSDILQYKIVGF